MKRKILLVDDDKDFLEIMAQIIEHWGYEVAIAANTKDTMDALANKKPDLVILDYIMPEDVSGIEILKKIRGVDKKMPVVMFTAKPESEAMGKAEDLAISAFIPKISPYTDTKKNLKNTLEMLLNR